MKVLAMDSKFQNYKFSLNKKERTLKVYLRSKNERKFSKHLIATSLSKQDIREIEDMTENDLLNFVKHDYQCTFLIWR